jgi:hypothetical protein
VRRSNRLAVLLTSKSQEVDIRSVAAFASPSLSVPLSTSLPRFLLAACRCTVQGAVYFGLSSQAKLRKDEEEQFPRLNIVGGLQAQDKEIQGITS